LESIISTMKRRCKAWGGLSFKGLRLREV